MPQATCVRVVPLRKFDRITGGIVDDLAHTLKPARATLLIVRVPLNQRIVGIEDFQLQAFTTACLVVPHRAEAGADRHRAGDGCEVQRSQRSSERNPDCMATRIATTRNFDQRFFTCAK
ncbi:MAG TPA: hypothetical protein VFN13_06605 [Rudaea sp.]|nr:hypothetical protein [Rudaea sp.]